MIFNRKGVCLSGRIILEGGFCSREKSFDKNSSSEQRKAKREKSLQEEFKSKKALRGFNWKERKQTVEKNWSVLLYTNIKLILKLIAFDNYSMRLHRKYNITGNIFEVLDMLLFGVSDFDIESR